MSLVNVTQRRQRKSLLGTHRRGRESILPQLSETLFSIHEEKKEPRDSILQLEDTSTFTKVEIKLPEPNLVLQRNDSIENSPVTHFESVHDSDREDLSFRHERTLPIKRLDSLFSPPPNDDSFVNHETMLANDDSVLATTLVDVSPEEENTLTAKFLEVNEQSHHANDIVTVNEKTSNRDQLDSKIVESEKKTVTIDYCDNTCRPVDRVIEFLDEKIREREEFRSSCAEQIAELQKKLDEAFKEIADIRMMKQFVLTKLNIPTREESENVEFSSTSSTLPSKAVPNGFMHDIKSEDQFAKPLRQTRAPRASVLLTPHSMSLNVQTQYEKLLK